MKKLIAAVLLFLAIPARANFTLTLSTAGPISPSVVTSTPSGIVCPGTCSFSFVAGSTVTLGEVTASTMAFSGWTGPNACSTNFPTCTIVLNASASMTANFDPLLAIRLSGNGLGIVTSSNGVNCSYGNAELANACASGATANYVFKAGTQVVLTEAPGSSSTFVGWTGDAGCSHASTCTITMNGYESITSTFSSTGPFTLAVTVVGQGTVTSSPAGINCGGSCAAEFAANTSVTLSTSAAAGYYFAGWANGGCSGTSPCVVTMTSTQQGLGGSQSPAAFFYKNEN